jgi:hypothetical protein
VPSPLTPPDLLGSWQLSRVIVDHLAGDESTVAGSTELVRQADGRIRWSEAGVLQRRGLDLPVSRVLYVEERPTGWFVTFDDGRDFHSWAVGYEVEHDCAPDRYVGVIGGDVDRWTVQWRVSGPAKDYTMTSVLTPAQAG